MRRVLEFEADFPDDQVEEAGEIVAFGGRTAAEVLRKALMSEGWSIEDVEQHSDNVWYFIASGPPGTISIYLSEVPPKYVVSVQRDAWMQDLLGRSGTAFREALVSLETAVVALGGRRLSWFKTYDAADRPHATIDEVMRA